MSEQQRLIPEDVTRELIDRGILVHSGWRGYRKVALTHVARDSLVAKRCQESFEAGCAFIFSVMLHMLEEDDPELTEADRRRMDALSAEIDAIDKVMRHKYGRGGL